MKFRMASLVASLCLALFLLLPGCGGNDNAPTESLSFSLIDAGNYNRVVDLVIDALRTGVVSPTLRQILDGTDALLTPPQRAYLLGLDFFTGSDAEIRAKLRAYGDSLFQGQGRFSTFIPPAVFAGDLDRIYAGMAALPLGGGLVTLRTVVGPLDNDTIVDDHPPIPLSASPIVPLQDVFSECIEKGADDIEEQFDELRRNAEFDFIRPIRERPDLSDKTKEQLNTMYINRMDRILDAKEKAYEELEKRCKEKHDQGGGE